MGVWVRLPFGLLSLLTFKIFRFMNEQQIDWVWITRTGSKYYGSPHAGYLRGNGVPVSETSAIKLRYSKATRGYV